MFVVAHSSSWDLSWQTPLYQKSMCHFFILLHLHCKSAHITLHHRPDPERRTLYFTSHEPVRFQSKSLLLHRPAEPVPGNPSGHPLRRHWLCLCYRAFYVFGQWGCDELVLQKTHRSGYPRLLETDWSDYRPCFDLLGDVGNEWIVGMGKVLFVGKVLGYTVLYGVVIYRLAMNEEEKEKIRGIAGKVRR